MDTVTQFYPLRMHAAHLLRAGELPLWNRTVFAGTPFLANPQWGLLYPGHWLMFAAPGPRAYTLINVIHIAWMGLGVFAWVWRIAGRRVAGALAAGAIAQAGGWTWAHLAFGSYLQVGSWAPWMFFAYESFFRVRSAGLSPYSLRPKGRTPNSLLRPESRTPNGGALATGWAALAGGAGAMQWLAGAPQLALYCHAGLLLYVVFRTVFAGLEKEITGNAAAVGNDSSTGALPFPRGIGRSAFAFLCLQALVSLGLSAPQWAPTRAFVADCERSGRLPLASVAAGALDLRGLAHAWIGGTGRPEDAEQILYPGELTLFWVGCAIVFEPLCAFLSARAQKRRRKEKSAGASAQEESAGAAEGYALTGSTLPPSLFAALSLALLIVAACLACWRPLAPVLYHLPIYGHFHDPRRILFLAYLATSVLAGLGFQAVWNACADVLRKLYPSHDSAPALSCAPLPRVPLRSAFLRALLVLAACAGLWESHAFVSMCVDTKALPPATLSVSDPDAEIGIRPGERFFAGDVGIQYSYNYTRPFLGRTLLPNLGALYGLEDIQGYDPFIPWRYALYMRRLNASPFQTITLYPSHFGLVRSVDSPWLSRFGALKARGPIDCEWPFFPPRVLQPGEQIDIPLAQPCTFAMGKVRAYVAVPRRESRKASLRMTATFAGAEVARCEIRGSERRQALGVYLYPLYAGRLVDSQSARADGLANRSLMDEAFLWDSVWPPRADLSCVHRAEIASVEAVSPAGAADRIVVENRSEVPVLLYSIGLPREAEWFRETATTGTFVSTWRRGFPDAVELHRVAPPASGEERASYERWAAGLSPDRVHVELGLEAKAPRVAKRVLSNWTWREKRAGRLRIALPRNHGGGWLVLSEPYFGGWTCRVDGAATAIYPADVLFRAAPVPAGAREVTMRYRPPGLAQGLLVASLAVAVVLLLFLRSRRRAVL
jgi:hypothetical protein